MKGDEDMAQSVQITTSASLQDVGALFQKAMRVSWLSENVTGAGTEFQKPPDGAFSDLETDPPQFSVMALLGGRGAEIQKSAVYMYAWDRGSKREIELQVGKSLAAFGVKARGKMRKFAAELHTIDPSAVVSGL